MVLLPITYLKSCCSIFLSIFKQNLFIFNTKFEVFLWNFLRNYFQRLVTFNIKLSCFHEHTKPSSNCYIAIDVLKHKTKYCTNNPTTTNPKKFKECPHLFLDLQHLDSSHFFLPCPHHPSLFGPSTFWPFTFFLPYSCYPSCQPLFHLSSSLMSALIWSCPRINLVLMNILLHLQHGLQNKNSSKLHWFILMCCCTKIQSNKGYNEWITSWKKS